MTCRGMRGATTAPINDVESILDATTELLQCMMVANGAFPGDVASAIFTVTTDLNAANPARAARELGWTETPLLCVQEMAAPDSLQRCIRVLLHWNTDRPPGQVRHIYLREAVGLRPDLVQEEESS